MSDDLVKRLRSVSANSIYILGKPGTTQGNVIANEAADRIEELEAKLAKAEEALELALELADNGLVDFSKYGLSCDADINKHYRTTLAALKGQDDE